jgi:hypothetical protein
MRSPAPRSFSKPFLLALLVVTAVLTGGAFAQPSAVFPETVIDVGAVNKGERASYEFTVQNEGDQSLEITEVKPSCGCTVAEYDKTVKPGGAGKITAVVDTTNFKGPIAKSVKVFTNDPTNPQINLVIKANIKTHVEIDPGYARFVAVHGEPNAKSVQRVWSREKPDLQILGAESPYPHVKVSYAEATVDEREGGVSGSQWRVTVELDTDAPVGPMADYIDVTTDHPERQTIRIPVSGFVRPVLSVTPRVADFGRREVSEPQTASLEIRNMSKSAVTLDEVSTDIEGVQAEIEPLEEGRLYKVLLTLEPGMKKGRFRGLVTINTTSSKQPVLEVNVKGVVL